jgi:hypothetical protein
MDPVGHRQKPVSAIDSGDYLGFEVVLSAKTAVAQPYIGS